LAKRHYGNLLSLSKSRITQKELRLRHSLNGFSGNLLSSRIIFGHNCLGKIMGKSLIIAEKPSVAGDIARALGGCTKEKDYFESDTYLITSAIGHLLEIGAPEGFEVKRGKWSLANLPVLPPEFALKPIEKTEVRLKLIQRFVKRNDIDLVINACDAGREGELIFTYIMHYTHCQKPVKRLWLQSMTPASIRAGFGALRHETQMRGLRDAAMCRSEADWLIGINGTRAMTAFNSKGGGFFLTTVGARTNSNTVAGGGA
jgi:DNA topoisomerase-3